MARDSSAAPEQTMKKSTAVRLQEESEGGAGPPPSPTTSSNHSPKGRKHGSMDRLALKVAPKVAALTPARAEMEEGRSRDEGSSRARLGLIRAQPQIEASQVC